MRLMKLKINSYNSSFWFCLFKHSYFHKEYCKLSWAIVHYAMNQSDQGIINDELNSQWKETSVPPNPRNFPAKSWSKLNNIPKDSSIYTHSNEISNEVSESSFFL